MAPAAEAVASAEAEVAAVPAAALAAGKALSCIIEESNHYNTKLPENEIYVLRQFSFTFSSITVLRQSFHNNSQRTGLPHLSIQTDRPGKE